MTIPRNYTTSGFSISTRSDRWRFGTPMRAGKISGYGDILTWGRCGLGALSLPDLEGVLDRLGDILFRPVDGLPMRQPLESKAQRAAEKVWPIPNTFGLAKRGASKRWYPWPSHQISTAPGALQRASRDDDIPRAQLQYQARRFLCRRYVSDGDPREGSASNRLGVTARANGSSLFFNASMPGSSSMGSPVAALMTGPERRHPSAEKPRRARRRCSRSRPWPGCPFFNPWSLISEVTASICWPTNSMGTGYSPWTAVVFCAMIAVIAAAPYTRKVWKVFRSQATPVAPEESKGGNAQNGPVHSLVTLLSTISYMKNRFLWHGGKSRVPLPNEPASPAATSAVVGVRRWCDKKRARV